MKNNLGSLILFQLFSFCLFSLMSHAEDFTHSFHVNKTDPYVKEGVILTLDLNQTSHDKVLLFDFKIKESDAYHFQRLDIEETDTGHHAQVHYVYLIYPLKSGKINIAFDLLKKVTTEDSVAYSFSGDRDNVKGLVTVDTDVKLPPLQLNVQALPENTLLVGDFKLTHAIKKHQAQAYEPLPIQVSIGGKGYPPLLNTLLPKEGNFTRFTEDPVVKSIVTIQGSQSTVTYAMALSHTQSFTLSPLKIKAFDPHTQKSYYLTVPEQHFDITTPKTNTLVDAIDSPLLLKEDWSWLKTLLGYVVVFTAGYLSALSWKWTKKQRRKEDNPFKDKIQNCNDAKALLQLLMATEDKHFTSTMEILEASLYGDGKINFKKVKQDLLEKII
ncbi:MAG: hypothetical protein DRG09_03745 [Epsilonproteobacteria bacterium]|nr:MAG: hypothetical protein DRG09_03745 [Campylobacterota bacterium]